MPKARTTVKSGQSLVDLVTDQIRQAIREGKYQPGDKVLEADVARLFGVSRTPVREALRRLEADGQLKSRPQRGVVVAELAQHQVTELYAFRRDLEGIAARYAARHASEAEIENLHLILASSRKAFGDLRKLAQINWQLHYAIIAASHNQYLIKTVEHLKDHFALLRSAQYMAADRPAMAFDEHAKVLDAIRRRDPGAAEAAARAHLENAETAHLHQIWAVGGEDGAVTSRPRRRAGGAR